MVNALVNKLHFFKFALEKFNGSTECGLCDFLREFIKCTCRNKNVHRRSFRTVFNMFTCAWCCSTQLFDRDRQNFQIFEVYEF